MTTTRILPLLLLTVTKLQSEPCDLDGYYIFKDARRVTKIVERFSPFSCDSNILIDLHSESTVSTLMIDYSLGENSTWKPELNALGNSSHNPVKEMCHLEDAFANSLSFSCSRPTRFLEIVVKESITIYKFQQFLTYTQAEFYAGCYELKKALAIVTKGLTDCLTDCRVTPDGYRYAGVKDNKCHCFKTIFGLKIVESHLCSNYCHRGLLCGKGQIIPLYFAIAVNCDSLSADCIYNASSCIACPYGYTGISCRLRDCSMNNGGCGAGNCLKLPEQFSEMAICNCLNGYMPRYLGPCSDIDECSVSLNECENQSSKCENTVGSYRCQCSKGLKQIDSTTCEDIDECQTTKDCGENKMCVNTWGSYKCGCSTGYKYHNVTSKCIDIDECLELCTDDICTNTEGSYTCKCKAGYHMTPGGICEDDNECISRNLCDHKTTACINWKGGFDCVCLEGYEKESLYRCIDVDECHLGLHTCGKTAACANTIGSFTCNCGSGYRTQVFSYATICGDIDECKDGAVCDRKTTLCINTLGSYSCQCRRGYIHENEFSCVISFTNSTTEQYDDFFTAEYVDMDMTNLIRLISITLGLVSALIVLFTGVFIKCRYFSSNPPYRYDDADIDTVSVSST